MAHDPARTTDDVNQRRVNTEFLVNKVRLKHQEVAKSFNQKYPHVVNFFNQKGVDLGRLRQHSAKVIATTALTGTLMFSPPVMGSTPPDPAELVKDVRDIALKGLKEARPGNQILIASIKNYLPSKVGPLGRSQEKNIEKIFQETIRIPAKATLEGEHLNTTYGYIGAEQHLTRYPGDSIGLHGRSSALDEGMAPGRGAWGYFAPSKSALTDGDIQNEKWYAVVQTLYLPDWKSRLVYLRDWYKYRKVLIVNTVNGNAVVAAIADAGPAAWTGKHFGGSPEVMEYLGGVRYKKGPVIVFFVDDPENNIPLGPVEYNKNNIDPAYLVKI